MHPYTVGDGRRDSVRLGRVTPYSKSFSGLRVLKERICFVAS